MFNLAPGPLKRLKRNITTPSRWLPEESGARYVDVTPWFCSTICTAVVGRYEVYYDQYHVTADYSIVLEQVLQQALRLPGHP